MRIGNHTKALEWYHCQWPWTTQGHAIIWRWVYHKRYDIPI